MTGNEPKVRKLWDVLTDAERRNIQALIDAKVPLVTFAPRAAYRRRGGREFIMTAWKNARPSMSVFNKAKKGWAIAALTGTPGGIDIIDVDDRNGGRDTWNLLKEHTGTVIGEVKTPGGSHYYVRSTGMPTVRHGGIDVLGKNSLVYLPGTLRPKYEGQGYEWVKELQIDPLAQPDSKFAEVLLELQVRSSKLTDAHFDTDYEAAIPMVREHYQPFGPYGSISWAHRRVASAEKGQRNHTLYKVAFYLGTQFNLEPTLHQIVIRELLTACDKCGLTADDGIPSCMDTISSGLRAGARATGGEEWQA